MERAELLDAVSDLVNIESLYVPLRFSRNADQKHLTLNWIVRVSVDNGSSFNVDYSAGIGHLPDNLRQRNTAEVKETLNQQLEVEPELLSVVYSLTCDFTEELYEDWLSNYGYEDNSESNKIYNACRDTSKKMVKCLGRECISKLRELLQDY